jgi:hypothetical protein
MPADGISLPFTISGNVGSSRPEEQLSCRDYEYPTAHPKGHILPHVRFRQEQTLVREGSRLVKLRNSA